ncbi:MAG: hypothetical protein E7055_20550, partial [Lentisphaerae bacterium]|nr:hypothetical protein [Lentisphaerota bacterium]
MRTFFLLCAAVFSISLSGSEISTLRETMPDSRITGYYAWDKGENGIVKTAIKNFRNPEYKKRFWENHKRLVNERKRRYVIFEVVFDKTPPKRRLPAMEDVEEQFKVLFESTPEAAAYPETVYAVVPSEEHTGKDIPLLNHIYKTVKKNWNIPVFQWLSEPLEPTHALEADGWIFDAYSISGDVFYRHCQKFMLTRKPVFPVIWAAEPGTAKYYKDGWTAVQKNAEQKITFCKELNLPIFLFAVCRRHGSVNCWMSSKKPFPEMRAFFQQQFAAPHKELTIPHPENLFYIPPDGVYVWTQDFSAFSVADHAMLRNMGAMGIRGIGLEFLADSKQVSALEWKFYSPDDLKEAVFTFTFSGNAPETGYSFDGKTWQDRRLADDGKAVVPLTGKRAFYFRIRGDGMILRKMECQIKGVPNPVKQVTMTPDADGIYRLTETLEHNRFLETIQSDSGRNQLLIRKGSIGILGKKGYSSRWSAMQKIVFAGHPVKKIRLKVKCFADAGNWKCSVTAGLSADGKKEVRKMTDPAK